MSQPMAVPATTAVATQGRKSPSRSYGVRALAAGSLMRSTVTPWCALVIMASSRPRESNATVSPVSAACTTGRPVSAARTALSEACWAGAQLDWNVESEVW